MLNLLARNWWLIEIRGVAAIAFGIMAFLWPGLTLIVLITLFAAFMLIDGVSLLVALFRGDTATRGHRLAVGLMGVLSIGAAIVAVAVPGLTALALLYLVAFWAIALGISQLITAFRLRRDVSGEVWLVLGGLLTIVFGVLLLAFPGTGLVSLIWLVGAWAIAYGFTSLVVAWRLRGLNQELNRAAAGRTAF
jgi:uncharacterized membrane protein HdeD (DUF308 family)